MPYKTNRGGTELANVPTSPAELRIIGIDGLPEIEPGVDLAGAIVQAAADGGAPLVAGDLLVVTQKIVSKAEGRLVDLRTVTPSAIAEEYARTYGKDPRQVEVVLRESARVVRMDRGLIIAQTRHGFVCANAGVDASNVPGAETVCLLPVDPDRSAEAIRRGVRDRTGLDVPVIISDSFGRPWREGIVNVAIGVAGLDPLADYRGVVDPSGYTLAVSVLAVADELASAAELVMGKVAGRPVAIVRGYPYRPATGSVRQLLMDPARDLFR
ncbi:MAG: coenzyme F420-0:L-glutamate ligase [Chloroflexi bacterium]|nr:coenzyme F420-0:L-glutamate ligase [Chloroflexota bacterium]